MTHTFKRFTNILKLASVAALIVSFPTQSHAEEADAQFVYMNLQEIAGQEECHYQPQQSSESDNFSQEPHFYNVNIVAETGEMPAEQKIQPMPEQQVAPAITCGSSFGPSNVKEI